jgi:hypothetical protein
VGGFDFVSIWHVDVDARCCDALVGPRAAARRKFPVQAVSVMAEEFDGGGVQLM